MKKINVIAGNCPVCGWILGKKSLRCSACEYDLLLLQQLAQDGADVAVMAKDISHSQPWSRILTSIESKVRFEEGFVTGWFANQNRVKENKRGKP